MSLFGKILLVVNLLAAGGVHLSGDAGLLRREGQRGRQNITAAGLRHVLVLQGMPLGGVKDSKDGVPPDVDTMPADANAEIPFRAEGSGGIPVKTISKKLLDSYFQNGRCEQRPQHARRLHRRAQPDRRSGSRQSEDRGDPRPHRAAHGEGGLWGWLMYQVETTPEPHRGSHAVGTGPHRCRERALAKTAEEMGKDVDDLQRALMARVEAMLSPPKGVDSSVATALKDEDLAAAANDEERRRSSRSGSRR